MPPSVNKGPSQCYNRRRFGFLPMNLKVQAEKNSVRRATDATAPGFGVLEVGISQYFLGKVLAGLGGFLTIPLLTRGLGVEGYGQLSLGLIVANWMPYITGGWLQQSILRYHKSYKLTNDYASYLRTLRLCQIVVSVTCGLASLVIMYLLGVGDWLDRGLVAVISLLNANYFLYVAIFQAELKPPFIVWSDFARTVTPAILIAAQMVALKHLTSGLAYAYIAIAMLAANFFLSVRIWHLKNGQAHFAKDIFLKLFLYGIPMGVWFSFSACQVFMGRFILQFLHMQKDLGLYSAFQDFLIKGGTLLFMPVTLAVHGLIMAKWAEKKYTEAHSTVKRAFIYQFALGVILLLTVLAGFKLVILFLLGGKAGRPEEFTGNLLLMFLVALSVILNSLALISHKGLEAGEKTAFMALLMGTSVLVNLVLSFVLAIFLGAVGVAIGLLVASSLYVFLTYLGSESVFRKARI